MVRVLGLGLGFLYIHVSSFLWKNVASLCARRGGESTYMWDDLAVQIHTAWRYFTQIQIYVSVYNTNLHLYTVYKKY